MPHTTLEFSSNIIEKDNIKALFNRLHLLLEKSLPTTLSSCKSRVIDHRLYTIGDGSSDNAFVHMTLSILSGREKQQKASIGQAIMHLLTEHFSQSSQMLTLQISLEIRDLHDAYFKN